MSAPLNAFKTVAGFAKKKIVFEGELRCRTPPKEKTFTAASMRRPLSVWMRLSMRGSWLSAGRFLRRGFGTGHERAMPMTPSPTSSSGAMCDLNGALDYSRSGGKSADAERLVVVFPILDIMLT